MIHPSLFSSNELQARKRTELPDVPTPIDDMLNSLLGAVVSVIDGQDKTTDYLLKADRGYSVYNYVFPAREVSEVSLTNRGWTIYLKEQE